MYKDNHLVFADREELRDFDGGVIGKAIDLGHENRGGEGHPFYFVLSCSGEMTGTGEPEIDLKLESSNDREFSAGVVTHVLYKELKKGDFGPSGRLLAQPCPLGMKRFVRLSLDTSLPLACAELTAMLTFDVQTNGAGVGKL